MRANPTIVYPFTVPIHLGRFQFELSGFGVAVLLAFFIAQVVSERELRRRGYETEARHLSDVLLAAVLGTLGSAVGAQWPRVGFVITGAANLTMLVANVVLIVRRDS